LDAVQQKNFEQVREQIMLGANVNVKDGDGQSLLHLAIKNGDMDIFTYLLQQAPNIDARNKLKQTPLHLAVINEQFDMVFLLLESGCNLHVKDNDGHEPIDLANIRQLESIRTLIAEYGPVTYSTLNYCIRLCNKFPNLN
jgi:ankyrin repeat protein